MSLFGDEPLPEERGAAHCPTGAEKLDSPKALLDWKPTKKYYSIGEVALLFAMSSSSIRFWTTEFELKVRTTRKGDRLYTPEVIQQLRNIYHLLRESGFTIAGAKARLAQDAAFNDSQALRDALLKLRSQLLEIRNHLA